MNIDVADATGSPSLAAGSDREPVLVVRDLRTEFGSQGSPILAVRGVSLALTRGKVFVLLGESGSGKSVTARSILGLYGRSTRITGEAIFDGMDLISASPAALRAVRGRSLALVPQDPSGALDPLRRIGSQIAEVLVHHRMTTKPTVGGRVLELLEMVGIPDPPRVARSFPHQLSGGMRQRAAIAIAVSCEPAVLFADEPTTALDVTVQAQILELFVDLQRSLDMAVLLVTHDVGVAAQIGDEVAVMYAGRIVEHGTAGDVLGSPRHPYSRALLASLPHEGVPRGELLAIPGRAVLAGEIVAGCPFAPRCTYVRPECTADEPVLSRVAPGRAVACSNADAVDRDLEAVR